MKKNILLAVSIGVNIALIGYVVGFRIGQSSRASVNRSFPPGVPCPYRSFYLGPAFSDNFNDGEALKRFLLEHEGEFVRMSFWIDTDAVDVDLNDTSFSFHASVSVDAPGDFTNSDGIRVMTTKLPDRLRFLNIQREGKYLSISGLFSVSEVSGGRQGISHVVFLTPESSLAQQ